MQRLTILAIIGIGIFFFASIRAGTDWGDDWAMYLHHAKNLSEGKAYNDLNFIYNPNYPTYAPKTYPPGFPIMLVPFYKCFGINYTALKVPGILSFLAALLILVFYYRKKLSPFVSFLLILCIGLCPFNWEFKDSILSDFPFLLTLVACAWLIGEFYHRDARMGQVLIIGVAIYISYAVRTLGILFVPALLLYDLVANRTVTKRFLIVSVSFMFFFVVQYLAMPHDNSYVFMLQKSYQGKNLHDVWITAKNALKYYRLSAANFWLIHYATVKWTSKGRTFSNIFFAIMLIGLVAQMLRKLSPLEFFVLLYIVVILLFPGFQGARYFMPLLPFFFGYVFGLFEKIKVSFFRYMLYAAILVPLCGFYFISYRHAEWKTITYGIQEKQSQDLFAYVNANTSPDDIFVLAKPRAFSLFTDRKASVYHQPIDKTELIDYMKSIHANYVITGIIDHGYFTDWANQDTTDFHFVYGNDYFKVLKTKF